MNPDQLAAGRALRLHVQPQLRGPAGQGRPHPPRVAAGGRRPPPCAERSPARGTSRAGIRPASSHHRSSRPASPRRPVCRIRPGRAGRHALVDKVSIVSGIAVPFRRNNVDTDQIIPAVFLKRITKTGFDDALFYAWRKDPDFMLNQPEYQNADGAHRRPRLRHRLQPRARRVGAARLRLHARCSARGSATSSAATPASRACSPGRSPKRTPRRCGRSSRRTRASPRRSTLSPRPRPSATLTVPFEIDDYTRWRLLEGLDDIGLTLQSEAADHRFRSPPREHGGPGHNPRNKQRVTE